DVLEQISTRLDRPARFRSPWGSLFSLERGGADAGYFLSDDKRLLFVVVEATREKASFTNYRDAIEPLRATMARVGAEFPDVKAGLTGAPVLGNDEMEAAFRLTLGVLTVAFRRFGMPILVLGTLAVSVCWSLGVVTLVVGHLSIFSIMFMSIVVGVGTDYGVYLLFRNDEERRLGRSPREALETTAMRAGPGMLGGALTAAGTFYVLMLTDLPGIRELGFIAGTSIILAWLSMMTLLPALVLLTGRGRAERRRETGPQAVRLVARITRHPGLVVGLAAVGAALSLVALGGVRFDYNLLHLQARG